ncbi:MAG: polysaccharide pyruvyl transferase family protein [Verrucomicrobiales bacterium]|nr:polysaccharide pyruvyl transferase family protein [Verrucomicrobiales bacterium]
MNSGPVGGEFEKTVVGNEMGFSTQGARRGHHRPGLEWLAPVTESNQVTSPSHDALLVGPADRYDVGEMLRPHVLTRVLNFSRFRCAGLVSADLTSFGGHSVRNYGESALEMTGAKLQMVHFGGDTLSRPIVDSYREAVSDQEEERFESLSVISDEAQLSEYVKRKTGQLDDFGYVLAPEGEYFDAPASFHGVGLSNPGELSPEHQERLFEILKKAQFIGIRDEVGAEFLEREGLNVHRMPCPLTALPQVCARQLRENRDSDAMEEMRHRFPNGWIAVEVGGIEEGRIDEITTALRQVAEEEDLGIVFFDASRRAGSGSKSRVRCWVDSIPEWNAAEFPSSGIWEVASMLLHSRLYCGTSLDCRIICMAAGVARVNIPTGDSAARSYCELWEHDSVPIEFSLEEPWSVGLKEALSVDLSLLQQHATILHKTYFQSLEIFCGATGLHPRLTHSERNTEHEAAAAALHHLHDEWLSDDKSLQQFRRLNRRWGRKSRVRSSTKRSPLPSQEQRSS